MSKLSLKPQSGLGVWGLATTVLFVALFLAKITLHFALPSFAIFGVGFVGLGLNIGAVVKGERSFIVLALGAFVGLFLVVFVGGEVLFPH
jgi:hypothetical protein